MTFPSNAGDLRDLFVVSDMEVGSVSVTGGGGLHIGGPPGGTPGSVNGTNGHQVTISDGATLVANPNSKAGQLSLGGELLLGTNTTNTGTSTLSVNGTASLNSTSTTKTFINGNGSTPGTDFSQLTANGSISLGGQLVLGQGGQGSSNGPCVALNTGDVATLVTTSGTLSGTFANAPNGAIMTMASSCQSTAPKVQINYTSNSVTATVVGASTPTTTTLGKPTPPTATTSGKGRLLHRGNRLFVIRGRIAVTERCQSMVSCRGRFSLTVILRSGRQKRVAIMRCASASFRVRANGSATVWVRLTTPCLRLLRAQVHHRLTVLFTSGSRTGQAGQRKLVTLVLKQPKRHKHRPPH